MIKNIVKTMAGMLTAVALLLPLTGAQAAEKYLSFILAERGNGDFSAKVAEVKQKLTGAGFTIVGEYPFAENSHIVVFTSDALRKVAARSEMGGFGAAMRVSINKTGDDLQVAYVNPKYLAYAYRMKSDLANTAAALEKALGKIQPFGSKALTKRKLGKYHYTFGMEYFDDPYELVEFGSHREAVAAMEKKLVNNSAGIRKIYRIDIPGKEETIFGISMAAGAEGDEHMDDGFQMSVVDFEELRQNAYLPYEIMVTGNQVIALHMRFRMAVHFPGLKMMGANSFMKLMSSPEAIRKSLEEATQDGAS